MAKPPDAALAHDKATEARGVLSDKMRVVTGCRTFGNQKVKLCDDDHIESTRIGSNGLRYLRRRSAMRQTLFITVVATPVSYTHLTLPTIYSV